MLEAPLLVIGTDRALLDGLPIASADELTLLLRQRRFAAPPRGERPTLLIEADRTTRAGEIGAVLRAAQRAGFQSSFVVRRLGSRPAPRP